MTVPGNGENDGESSTGEPRTESQRERLASEASGASQPSHAALLRAMDQARYDERLATARSVASHMAHDLGTPLNVIQMRATMIASGEFTGADVVTSAKKIAEQAERMTAMLNEVLAIVRRNREPALVNLLEVGRTAVDIANVAAGLRKVSVVLDPTSEPVHVQGDSGKLLQVMLNLILNGVQATAEGGTVLLATRPAQRSSAFDPSGPPVEHASIEVKDSGAGVPKDLFARIFKPFFTTRGAGEGAGLGLAIANGIVKDYGGWIDVESEVGKGSRFTVYLPRGAR